MWLLCKNEANEKEYDEMNLFHQQIINIISIIGQYILIKAQTHLQIYTFVFYYLSQLFFHMSNRAELKKKYYKSPSFKAQMDQAEQNYQRLVQRSIYSGLPASDCNFIKLHEGKNRMQCQIYFIDASQQYAKARSIEKLTLAMIKKIPKPNKDYIIVYLNDPEHSSCFSDFKTVFEIMPIQYYINLVKILLLQSTFFQKASRFFVFGTIPKFINNQIDNIDDLDELAEKLVMDKKQLMGYVSIGQKQNHENPKPQMNPVSINRPGQKRQIIRYEINQYDKAQNGLPQLFQILVYYFQEHPEGLQLEGIFRKSANIIEQNQAMQRLSNKHYKCLQEISNPHIVANMIKKFLNQLKTPIIPYQMFHQLMDEQNLTSDFIAVQMKQLAHINLAKILTLMFLLQFLMSSVISKSNKNKMTAENIAICFAPCIMWAQERSIKDIVYATKSVKVLSIMIKNFEQVFGSPKDQKKLYRQSYYQQKNKSLEAVMLISDIQDEKQKKESKYNAQMVSQQSDQTQPNQTEKRVVRQRGQKKEEQKQKPEQQKKKRGIFTSKLSDNKHQQNQPNSTNTK